LRRFAPQLAFWFCVLTKLAALTAIANQTSHKKNFESVAKQRFQNFSWLGFEREAL
jgi:hypothetical protein